MLGFKSHIGCRHVGYRENGEKKSLSLSSLLLYIYRQILATHTSTFIMSIMKFPLITILGLAAFGRTFGADARVILNDFALSSPSLAVRNFEVLAVEKPKRGVAVANLARAPLGVGSPEPVTPEPVTPDPANPDPESVEPEPVEPEPVKPQPKPALATTKGGQNDGGPDGALACSKAKRESVQTRSDSAGVNLYDLTARALRIWLKKAAKHFGKSKSRRADSLNYGGNDVTTPLPTKDDIKANWASNPKFDHSKLFFYSSPPGPDTTETFTKANYPGYLTVMSSFEPVEWRDKWAFSKDEGVQAAFLVLASEAFAEVATGKVYAFLPDSDGDAVTWKDESFWNNELKILQASDAVTSIVRINENLPHAQSVMKGSDC